MFLKYLFYFFFFKELLCLFKLKFNFNRVHFSKLRQIMRFKFCVIIVIECVLYYYQLRENKL